MDARTPQPVIGGGEAGDETQQLRERLEQAESRLLQLEKMAAVGQIAAGVAHEINNPVGFISSNLGSLKTYMERVFAVIAAYEKMEAALPPEHPTRVEMADVRAEVEFDYLRQDIPDLLTESLDGLARVKEIINDLKDFSRVDDGQRQEADLHRGLESTLNVIRNEIKYKAEVIREFGDLPLVNCVPAQINQVFMNLLSNAAQAIETMGRITLRTGADEDWAWVEVSDTGKGIPPEVQARIFEPFFTTKPVGKGTGLGLSISRDIVERHGGKLEVSSTVGQGATFRMVLPVAGLPEKGG
ncbi:MAG TPA: ATP-binding protein [Aromatoleum sp.]|uniref:ATP-binding protein n=1 Tax=Aromatoleum sp. TaxID=2307007 RepID=UPI002B46D787|nr:ATP-binding protein [Aromatoleum sp.]HJV27182.1 ATP-binding protein [Aromatoleum sp.]